MPVQLNTAPPLERYPIGDQKKWEQILNAKIAPLQREVDSRLELSQSAKKVALAAIAANFSVWVLSWVSLPYENFLSNPPSPLLLSRASILNISNFRLRSCRGPSFHFK